MALDAAQKIKRRFKNFVQLQEFTIDSEEGKKFKVSTSTNVFINGQLLPIQIWLDQSKFENHIEELIGANNKIERDIVEHQGYDVVIVGGGPAGLSAGIYCARARLKTLLLEGGSLGGQVATTEKVENYPGVLEISGSELIGNMEKQANLFNLEIKTFNKVHKLFSDGLLKKVYAGDAIYSCKTIIIAGGQKRTALNLPREDEFSGKGVSYCAICDANFFKGKNVAVAGGGDTAIEDAIYLCKFASKVFIIHRRDELRATKILQEAAFCINKISFLWSHTIQELIGNSHLEGIIIKDLKTGDNQTLALGGLFVAVGSHPHTELLKDFVKMDEHGYVIVNDKMETTASGVFAAGDIRATPLRQIATAVGDGAIAAISAERYVTENFRIHPAKIFHELEKKIICLEP